MDNPVVYSCDHPERKGPFQIPASEVPDGPDKMMDIEVCTICGVLLESR